MSLNWAKKDLIGEKFGRLLVISESKKRTTSGLVFWECVCDCGNKKIINGSSLRRGKTQSCGCLMLESVRIEKGEASFNKLFSAYKRGAENREHIFSLEKEVFRKLTSANCFYCGDKPLQVCKNNGKSSFFGNYTYNGIDRLDNTKGYIENNCVTCCFICNQMKLTMGLKEFVSQCKKISKFTTKVIQS